MNDDWVVPPDRFDSAQYIENRLTTVPAIVRGALRTSLSYLYMSEGPSNLPRDRLKAAEPYLEPREKLLVRWLFTRTNGRHRATYGLGALRAAKRARYRCQECSFPDVRALHIDHVDGRVVETAFACLCANCHNIKSRTHDWSGRKRYECLQEYGMETEASALCTRCGVRILDTTARRTGGLCMPCSTGRREPIEQARALDRQRRELHDDPAARFWRTLVHRVHHGDGVAGLTEPERLYFAGCLLNGEVHNGGFSQFFTNSSGAHYGDAVRFLALVGSRGPLALLEEARTLLFPSSEVPTDTAARRLIVRVSETPEVASRLDELDAAFWADSENCVRQLATFAKEHGLY
jgi:hypothetical protein